MKEFDMGWGESVAIRSALLDSIGIIAPTSFGYPELLQMGYTKHEGDEELINRTRLLIYRQTGLTYAHVLLTNGATGAATIAMRAYKQCGATVAVTRAAPYFPIYPKMIEAAGLGHLPGHNMATEYKDKGKIINLIDSPSNPLGKFAPGRPEYTIWDAVYYTKAYFLTPCPPPLHSVMVGSYSKLLGINGLRVGWIATNDDLLYERLKSLVTAEYCGLSAPTTRILIDILQRINWPLFERTGRKYLDANREEWSNLEKYFEGMPVGSVGMFYYAPIDKACKRLLKKSHIIWTPGSSLGTDDGWGRFNIGQDCKLVREAVREIIKNDRR